MSDGLIKKSLHLSRAQAHKLRAGHPIQLSAGALKDGHHHLMLHPSTHKRVMKAVREGKGARIHLSEHEYHRSAEGLREFLQGAKQAAQQVGKFYTQHIKPVAAPFLRKGAKALLDAGVAAASLAEPELAPVLAAADKRYGDKLVNYVGSKTGAYGLKHRKHVVENYAKNLRVSHPANDPIILPSPGGLAGSGTHHVVHHHLHHASAASMHASMGSGEGMRARKPRGRKPRSHHGSSFLPS